MSSESLGLGRLVQEFMQILKIYSHFQGGGNRVRHSNGLPDPTVFSQEIPVMNQREGEGGGGGGGRRMPAGPPILPPHLLQVSERPIQPSYFDVTLQGF